MHDASIVHSFFLIFTGAAVIASIALFTRQPLTLAYILLGALIGPYGMMYVSDPSTLTDIAEIGIIFLLFLLGLDMQPSALIHMMRKATTVAVVTALAFALIGYAVGVASGFTQLESLIIGLSMMFSSTIIGIKLLPTTVLHHKHIGELVVGLLLLQDLIAIIVLLALNETGGNGAPLGWLQPFLMLPLLVGIGFFSVKYVILKLLQRFDRFHEYIFLLAIGWCLGMGSLAEALGLSQEIGAFVAGISLATSPISQYIAESLKPLRDFFLILFFFSIGAGFNLNLIGAIAVPSLILALLMVALKPVIFHYSLRLIQERRKLSWEVGFRLGQTSEFSLLIAFLAMANGLIGIEASHVIQATTILTFVLSTYIVIFNYPNPIAVSDRLRRD